MRPIVRGAVLSLAVAAVLTVAHAAPATAAEPVVTGCVGASVSAFARTSPEPYGTVASSFAHAPDGQAGLGDSVQLLQAGVLPFPGPCYGG